MPPVHARLSGVYRAMHVDSRTVIQKIEADGWALVRVSGSHHQFRHPIKPGITTVPHPRKDLPKGTVRSIERQSGVHLGS